MERWRASGEPARVFAARAGLNASTLAWWASQLRRRRQARPPTAVGLVRVVAAAPEQAPGAPVEILLAGGHVLRVGRGFDPVALRAVLATLEER